MENEIIICPFCDSSNINPLINDSKYRYKCESCGTMVGGKGMPLDPTPG
jgi:transposase-like protein